ncbi:uncharacterized protein LOC143422699 [Xylocopa sonorina]|uniref:uncharacterized protein LOC143422699 n=1 Tax=Xylocopa sonorina TaxID=1818115 RepID=UPI00403ABC0F
MNISKCALGNQDVSQPNAQQKFYQWILEWMKEVHAHANSDDEEMREVQHQAKPDVPTLASFLQAIGFKLLSFGKQNDSFIQWRGGENTESKLEQGTVQITIECDVSNMKAILELGRITCQCPKSDRVKDVSFSSVNGTGPSRSATNIVHKIEEAGSDLLPRLSKDVTEVLRDVSHKLFDTIMCESKGRPCEPKLLRTENKVTRSYTQPEIRLCTNSTDLRHVPEAQRYRTNSDSSINRIASSIPTSKPVLQCQKVWDINVETENSNSEPRLLPPKPTSSPAAIAELCNSLGHISLGSETESPKSPTEYILKAQQNLEKALKVLLVKKSTTINDISLIQGNYVHDIQPENNDGVPVKSNPAIASSPCKATLSNVKPLTYIKPLTKLNHWMPEQQLQAKTISPNIVQTPKTRRCIESIQTKSVTRMKVKPNNSKSQISRSSFYIPASSKPSDMEQKSADNKKYSTNKLNVTIDSNTSYGNVVGPRKFSFPEQQVNASSKPEPLNTTITRTSMIKPPTKISKAIPVKIRPIQSPKISTKPKVSIFKE